MTIQSININHANLALYSMSLFVSAALMFGLQPMVGKMLLPIVGGTPSGWIVAMAFFQVMLLAGYFLAHALSRFSPRIHGLMYIACLAAGGLFLPVDLTEHSGIPAQTPMAFDVMKLLTVAVAVPFAALSASASTLQKLFTATGHTAAQDPYFLYVASNLGSFAGLLLYPFVIEPHLALTVQTQGWLFGYMLLIGLAAFCLCTANHKIPVSMINHSGTPVNWKKRLEWCGLAFIPSGLLLAVTMHISTDLFSVPMLWILPLAIYLLTFVAAFSQKPRVRYDWILRLQPIAVAVSVSISMLATNFLTKSWLVLAIDLASLAIVSLMCHMRLANTRPVDDHRYLSDFYLMIALGGALGGILNAFVAPFVFDSLLEYPLLMTASNLANENIRTRFSTRAFSSIIAACFLMVFFVLISKHVAVSDSNRNMVLILFFALTTLHPKASLAVGVTILIVASVSNRLHPLQLTERNFYGIIKIRDFHDSPKENTVNNVRVMIHGTTIHGLQVINDKKLETEPLSYFSRSGPLGQIISLAKPRSIATVGLGAGMINCYAETKRSITFFEIDPAVVKAAQEHFTYLSKCGAGMPRIILGDARLELNKLTQEKFDLIILDAFSSDIVPTHLLTKEAMQIYLRRLNPNGILLFHISSRYFKLDRPIAATGRLLGLTNRVGFRNAGARLYAAPSRWIALAHADAVLEPLASNGWDSVAATDTVESWTDDYTNLLDTLDFQKK